MQKQIIHYIIFGYVDKELNTTWNDENIPQMQKSQLY